MSCGPEMLANEEIIGYSIFCSIAVLSAMAVCSIFILSAPFMFFAALRLIFNIIMLFAK